MDRRLRSKLFSKVMLLFLVCFVSLMGKRAHGEYKVKICRVTYLCKTKVTDISNDETGIFDEIHAPKCCLCGKDCLTNYDKTRIDYFCYYEDYDNQFCVECFKILRCFEAGMVGSASRKEGWNGDPDSLNKFSSEKGITFLLLFTNEGMSTFDCRVCKKPTILNLIDANSARSFLVSFNSKNGYSHSCCMVNTGDIRINNDLGCRHFISLGDSATFDPLYNRWMQKTSSKLDLIRELKAKWEKK